MQPLHLKRLKDRTAENIPGAAPEPYITTLDETEDGMLLRCVVRGAFPKPEVVWQDSDGNILPAEDPQVSERGGTYNIFLQTTVNKAGRFRCVATQKEINHQIYAETYVPLKGSSTGLVVTIVVLCVVVLALLGIEARRRCCRSKQSTGDFPA
ncbi:butyrophilin-like protein 9 [Thunnus maccoyii]|uniref:butyrophilin-like protein 9 n=1 Tax=Thunnus maccoyii TaxID=8240 RepID=UPI001C4CF6B3|nr:butyrophilin-like protein 9 [Thunnus maccoyii]